MMGEIIKQLRGNRSKAEFARLIGVTSQAVANYEEGRIPKKEILDKIAAATGKRIRWVIEDIETDDKGVN